MAIPFSSRSALDRARAKAYIRLLPLLCLCYGIAYVDRINVSLAKLEMTKELEGFDNAVIGLGLGMFFLGYLLLEIPGTLLVERWSARKWFCRIMVSWGIVAGLTAWVQTPTQFYIVRFLLGVAEAGFFPGVIVFLTHWFPVRDRAQALAYFFVATPVAQAISPKISYYLLRIGTSETFHGVTVTYPKLLGLSGWQWMYIGWGIPAVILGVLVLFLLPDWPREARWLDADERKALEDELQAERLRYGTARHHGVLEAVTTSLRHPKVLALAAAYFFVVTGSYGIETFLPSILKEWYDLNLSDLTWALIIPPLGGLAGQILVGRSSDKRGERRLHASMPIYIGAAALGGALLIPTGLPFFARLALAVALFTVALTGVKAYMPAFWALPSLFLTEALAASSIGLINSLGNLGGFAGPSILGKLQTVTGSFVPGLIYLVGSMIVSATIILTLGLGHRVPAEAGPDLPTDAHPLIDEEADSIIEPV